jgi:hypothetical protein
MTILLTDAQWASIQQADDSPARVSDPSQNNTFVLVPAGVYERFKAMFEDDPVTPAERQFHLQEFGRRAGWDDPEMDIYDDLDPRRKQ